MYSPVTRVIVTFSFLASLFVQWGCHRDEPESASRSGQALPEVDPRQVAAAREFCEHYVRAERNWTEIEFYKFIHAMNDQERLSTMKALQLLDSKANVETLKAKNEDVLEIQKRAVWVSENLLKGIWRRVWPGAKTDRVQYHELCQWVANELEVGGEDAVYRDWLIRSQPTIILERAICEKLWADTWNQLNPQQRTDLLLKLDPNDRLKDKKAGLMVAGGTAALAILGTTEFVAGFQFYVTMSVTVSTVAGWFGVTLPMAAYTTSSSVIAFLAGPVGWAIAGVGAVTSAYFLGKADPQKTAALIVQIHVIKAAHLQEAGISVPDVPSTW
jgi:uncharacterized protein YaaW (UPF0174 family)